MQHPVKFLIRQLQPVVWKGLHKVGLMIWYFRITYRIHPARYKDQKVFCIGQNKTGTTSMQVLLQQLDYQVAPQLPGELLLEDWLQKRYGRIVDFAIFAGDAFQDIPFSLPDTYKHLDQAFPESKFILTIRPSADEWHQSLTRFHSKIFGGKLPERQDLEHSKYVKKGWMYKVIKSLYNTPDEALYDPEIMKKHYDKQNQQIIDYFNGRREKLLVIDIAKPDAAEKICDFLESEKRIKNMPWSNKSK